MRSLQWISFCSLLLLSTACFAQLVNIESKRMQTDSVRFVLTGDLLFNYTNTDGTYIYRFDASLSTQFKSKDYKSIYFFVGNLSLIRSQGQDFQNSWFLHARYNRKLNNDRWRVEAFVQDQSNELLTINSRTLIGAGLRLKLFDENTIQGYLGNSYMYEMEKSDIAATKYYNHRNSTYLSVNMNFSKVNLDLINTIYFQPLYNDLGNYRLLEQFKAEIPIIAKLRASALFNYYFNSITPLGRSEYSSVFSLGLTLSLSSEKQSKSPFRKPGL